MAIVFPESFTQFLVRHTPLSRAETEILKPFLDVVCLGADDYFLQAGSPVRKMAFLLSGVLRRFVFDEQGNRIVLQLIDENHFVADSEGFYQRTVSASYVQAVTSCRLLVIPLSEIDRIRLLHPKFQIAIYLIGQKQLLERIQNDEFLRIGTSSDQYHHFITHFPELARRVPLQDIASYLRISPSSLSRIRRIKK